MSVYRNAKLPGRYQLPSGIIQSALGDCYSPALGQEKGRLVDEVKRLLMRFEVGHSLCYTSPIGPHSGLMFIIPHNEG